MLLVAFLTHSLYAVAFFIFMMLRRNSFFLLISMISAFVFVFVITRDDSSLFFISSGLIRLVGINHLENIHGFSLWVGHGLGSGDIALERQFSEFGIDTIANGFLFSLIYDVGLMGMLCLYLAYTRSLFDFVLFNFLLLNFGIGSFLIPVLMYMGVSENNQQNPKFIKKSFSSQY
jgi:hypothetical protein